MTADRIVSKTLVVTECGRKDSCKQFNSGCKTWQVFCLKKVFCLLHATVKHTAQECQTIE